MIRKTICMLFAACLCMLSAAGCGRTGQEALQEPMTIPIREINKHGNLMLDTTLEEMKDAGIEVGDLISVFAGDSEYVMPVGTSYTDVDSGEMICRFDLEDSEISLSINYGSFAVETGTAEKQTIEEEPGYRWDMKISQVGISLKEKEGYLDEYRVRHLDRTDAREDYPDLTDEEFANFRPVSLEGIKAGTLYRSSTPIEPAIGRNEYAMAAMEKAGIRTVINLDDSPELMRSYETFPGSYYSGCQIANPQMSYDFESADFGEKIRESIRFMIRNEVPCLIHCKEGKDRTGILCAVLECFAGTPSESIWRDYMTTYENYYGVRESDDLYGIILENNLQKTLCGLFGIADPEAADLREEAEDYLLSTGLTREELDLLREKFCGE